MGLKHGENPAKIPCFGGAERCPDFRRVMRIIIDDGYAVARLHLKPAVHAAKPLKPACNEAGVHTHIASRSKSRRGVQHVVHARNVELEFLLAAAVKPENKSGTKAFNVHIGDADVGRSRSAVSDNTPLDLRNKGLNGRFIEAQ